MLWNEVLNTLIALFSAVLTYIALRQNGKKSNRPLQGIGYLTHLL